MRWPHFTLLPLLLASAAFAEPKESCESLRKSAKFSAYFERVDIEKLVQTVSDATCKTFILGDNVKGQISIIGPESAKMSLDADQFYAAFLAALDANGLAVINGGRTMRIVEKAQAPRRPIALLDEGAPFPARDEMVTRIFRLRHLDFEAGKALLTPLVSPGAEIISFAPDVLIVSELGSNLTRIDALLTALDVERKPTDVLKVISIAHADAQMLADEVQKVLTPKPSASGSKTTPETLTLTADARTNVIVAVASVGLLEQIEKLIAQLDVALPGDGRAHVYKLINGDAKEIATNLEAIVGGGKAKQGPGSAAATNGEVRITANESLNALIIVASTGDYRNLRAIISELDAPQRQVFIETVIMEVSSERDSQIGASGHVVLTPGGLPIALGSEPGGAPSSGSLTSLLTQAGALAGLQGPTLTVLKGVTLPQFGLSLAATQTTSDVNVLQMPHILTIDNKEAETAVGQRIPFQNGVNPAALTQLSQSGNAAAAATVATYAGSVTRERIELKLTVKPHIGDGATVRLEINQQAEELDGENPLGPITATRGQKTAVVVEDEQTVVLGGIMQNRTEETVNKTPFLGDVPLLGRLFRNTVTKKAKVNLLVLLTPHIIRDASDFKRIVEKKMAEQRHVLEQMYGASDRLDPPVDFARKPGPLFAMERVVRKELARVVEPRLDAR